jgi:hypothetical protein
MVQRSVLKPNNSTGMAVTGVKLLGTLEEAEVGEVINIERVSNWKLSGGGKLVPSNETAIYSAPATAPAYNPVTISVEVTNVLTNEGTKGKVILFARIFIENGFLHASLDGAGGDFEAFDVSTIGDMILISGSIGTHTSLSITVNLSGPGTKAFDLKPLIATNVISAFNTQSYSSFYYECTPRKEVATAGSVTITKLGKVGEYVDGSFGGALANANGPCGNPGFKTLKGIDNTNTGKKSCNKIIQYKGVTQLELNKE